ncbi:MAG: hypothetical protein PHF84_02795 [bacterium]|nr:hypothetical protein [bacterium]
MFKELTMFFQLRKSRGPLFVLPDGLYTRQHQYVRNTGPFVKKTGWRPGAVLRLRARISLRNWNDNFIPVRLYQSRKFRSVNERELDLAMLMKEIGKLHYSRKMNPYESFLEVVLIKSLMESMSNSKSLLGSIWSTGGLLSGSQRYAKSTFAYFARNVQEKNDVLAILQRKLSGYPDRFILYIAEYPLPCFDAGHSQHSTFLEYRILQVRYKLILQDLCIHSSYLTGEEKKRYDKALVRIKELMKTFPVTPLKRKNRKA